MTHDSDPAFKIDCIEFAEASLKEVVLLGLIAEEPSHAYRLEEKIRTRHMTEWTNISISSIYRVLSGLQEKGLIDTTLEHEGQGATRKVHVINHSGQQVLARGVAHHIVFAKPMKNPLSVSLAFLTHAPYSTVVEKLAERAAMVQSVIEEMGRVKEMVLGFVDEAVAEQHLDADGPKLRMNLLFDHILYHVRAEGEFLAHARKCLGEIDPRAFYSEDSTANPPSGDVAEQEQEKVSK